MLVVCCHQVTNSALLLGSSPAPQDAVRSIRSLDLGPRIDPEFHFPLGLGYQWDIRPQKHHQSMPLVQLLLRSLATSSILDLVMFLSSGGWRLVHPDFPGPGLQRCKVRGWVLAERMERMEWQGSNFPIITLWMSLFMVFPSFSYTERLSWEQQMVNQSMPELPELFLDSQNPTCSMTSLVPEAAEIYPTGAGKMEGPYGRFLK